MPRFASGKKAWGISDRSGFRYRRSEMRREWNGAVVGKDEYELKHPQLTPTRKFADPEAIKDPRPETQVDNIYWNWNPVGKVNTGATAAVGQVTVVTS